MAANAAPSVEQELHRAEEARQIISNPLVAEALDGIEGNVLEWWEKSNIKDHDFREKCWAIYCASRSFRKALQTHIETGKMARAQVEQESKKKLFGII